MTATAMPAGLLASPDAPDPLQSLTLELQRQLATKRDLMADTRLVSLAAEVAVDHGIGRSTGDLDLNVDLPDGTEAFAVTRHAHSQIATHLGLGWRLYDRLLNGAEAAHKTAPRHRAHPDLLAHLVNGLLGREHSTRMLRTMDGKVRAFLSNSYRPRDNWDLLSQAVLPVLRDYPGVTVRQAQLSETNLYVKIALPLSLPVGPPAVGDRLHAGMIVRNSEVGAGSLLVAPFSTVLLCTNGAVHDEYGQRQRHVAGRITNEGAGSWELYSDATLRLDDEAFFSKVRDVVRATLSEEVFHLIVADMNALVGMPVDAGPQAAVEVLAKHVGASETEADALMRHLIEGGDLSAYGYLNAVTAVARDLEDVDRQTELQTLAGRMVAKPNEWVPALSAA